METVMAEAGAAEAGAAEDARYAAVRRRARDADGRFVYAVRTTGVFCRPSCGARLPKPGNVVFYRDAAEAERAGFRACLRCRPGDDAAPAARLVARACGAIAAGEAPPSPARLARALGVSASHLHRSFVRVLGVTPGAYAAGRRQGRARDALAAGGRVTDAIYDAGYAAPSRFYADADAALGMTPGSFRAGGAGETIRFAVATCALGRVLVAATARGVCRIALGDDADALERDMRARFAAATLTGPDAAFARTLAAVVALVERPGDDARRAAIPLDVRGTAFQAQVWQALRAIPPGEVAGYGAVAAAIGRPGAARAVAQACGQNPLAVAVPCHRVVGADGAITGYRWGVARKHALLAAERAEGPAQSDADPVSRTDR